MKKYLSVFNLKVPSSIILLSVLVVAGGIAPRYVSNTKALDCANVEQIPSVATFNPFQVGQNYDGSYSTDDGSNCKDEPTLSVKPQGSSLYYPSANANVGDTLTVSAYIHNGARQDIGTQDEAYNITATFNVDTTSGSSHTISVVLNGQDGNGNPMGGNRTGNITINTPAGASLQVNSGSGVIEDHLSQFLSTAQVGSSSFTVNLGNQMACFDYARFLNFTVTVVGGQNNPMATGSISASDNHACPASISVTWQTQNVEGVGVYNDQTGNLISGDAGNTLNDSGINDGQTYTYSVWHVDYSQYPAAKLNKLASSNSVTATSGCVTPPPANSSFNLYYYPKTPICTGQAMDFSVQDATSDLNGKEIFWDSTLNGQKTGEHLAGYNQFVNNGFWEGYSQPYPATVTINGQQVSGAGQWSKTATIYAGPGLSNPVNQTVSFTVLSSSDPQCGGQPAVQSDYQLFNNPKTPICVGQTEDFAVLNATSDLNGKQIYWSSTVNGLSLGENLSAYSGQVVNNGSWNGTSNPITVPGTWVKKSTIYAGTGLTNPIDRQVSFTVLPGSDPQCGGTQPTQVTCVANPSVADVGQSVNFSANGDDSKGYSWVISGGTITANAAKSFNTTFNSPGTYNAIVSNGTTANGGTNNSCSVTIRPTQIQTLTCQATSPLNININQSVSFIANGGQGQLDFIAGGQGPQTVTGANQFSKTFTTSGSFNVSVKDSTGTQVSCGTVVVAATQPNQLTCAADQSSANVGDTVSFRVQGGTYPYNWATSNNSNAGSGTVFYVSFSSPGNKTVSVHSADGQTASCGVTINPNACVSNTNYALNAGTPVKNGSNYSVTLTWTSGGSNQVKITQVTGSSETTLTTGGNNGSFTVNGLAAGSNFLFKLYDAACNTFLTSVQVSTPVNPGQLTCTADQSSANVGDIVTFRAQGGSYPYTWATSNNSNAGSGSIFNVSFASAGNKSVSVSDSSGQTASCGVTINQPGQFICQATNSPVASGSAANFSVSNGTGPYTWQANGGNPSAQTLSGTNFSSVFTNATQSQVTQTVTVSDSAGHFATCQTVVLPGAQVCTANTNYALNAGTPVKNGSNYSVTLTWSSTGNNQVKITQVTSSGEATITTGNNSGNFTVNGLAAGGTHIFKLYDAACNTFLTSVQVVTPANPGQLTCSADQSSAGIGEDVTFRANGGTPTYTWATSNNSNAGSGSIFIVHFQSAGNKAVTVTDGAQQTAGCSVVITAPASTGGNITQTQTCVNNSCNTTTFTDNSNNSVNNSNNTSSTNTTSSSNNSINNSYNTTNNYSYTYTNYPSQPTYPNYPNYVYINSTGNTVPANQFSQITLTKQVSYNNSGWQNSVSVPSGQTVQFLMTVTDSGNANANNVRITDQLPAGLTLVSGSVQVNGSNVSDSNLYSGMYVGNLTPGQTQRVQFSATVSGTSQSTLQNNATASSDNAGSSAASAWVFVSGSSVLGGNVSLSYSKRAFNETQNVDATSAVARKEDFITYTLTATNNGNSPATDFVVTDDLSQVLPYADITDNGGGTVTGNMISFPAITVPAGGSITRSFRVRVKYSLGDTQTYVMTNTYGNSAVIRINNTPKVLGAFVAPKTGADSNAFVFAGLLCAAFAVYKKKNLLIKLIFT